MYGRFEIKSVPHSLFTADRKDIPGGEIKSVPHSLSTADGKDIPGGEGKSDLVEIITKQFHTQKRKIIVLNVTFLIQQHPLPACIKTCEDISGLIIDKLKKNSNTHDDLHVVFDTYISNSLKTAT